MTESMNPLGRLSFPSTEIQNVRLEDVNGSVILSFEFPAGESREQIGIIFDQVRAYQNRAESHCTEWHVESYDTISEVQNSPFVTELIAAMPEDMRDLFEMHHYVIYLDSMGCYEVVAKSWSFLLAT